MALPPLHHAYDSLSDLSQMSTNGANHDPAVFGGPENSQEYAMQWKPGRENAKKIMTWGNELADIKSCPTAAGRCACVSMFVEFCIAQDALPLPDLALAHTSR